MGVFLAIVLAAVAPAPQGVGSSVVTNGVDGGGAVVTQGVDGGGAIVTRGVDGGGAVVTQGVDGGGAVVTQGVDGGGAVATNQEPVRPVGWPESGEMALSFAAARKKLAVKLAKRGWRHVHTIELGKDRKLESWDRGGEELTLMTWRIGTGRTGYSLGITKKGGK